MLEPRESVRNLSTYQPPLGGREGLRLDFNENVAGCSPRVLARLREITSDEIARYPERGPVEAVVADFLGIKPNELVLTNGVDEASHLLCQTFLQPGDEALTVVPTFAMYEISAAATGARVVRIPADADFKFPTSELRSKVTSRTRLIAIANPNNPTGSVVGTADLLNIASWASRAAILVDEAYFEFYGETLLGKWRSAPNLFVARTFSKAYGMAGLRVGMLAGHPAHISMVNTVSSPYNVNGVALACLPNAIADQEYISDYVLQVRKGRDQLQQELGRWGIPYWPSEGNFVLANFGRLKKTLLQSMRTRGVLMRDRSQDYRCEGCVRITLGTTEQTSKLLRALRGTLAEIGATEVTAR
jgi:histidinol-phosphate aminotransferase